MNIYLIVHDEEGDNFDLHVEAATEERAIELWRDFYWPASEGYDEDRPDTPDDVKIVEPTGQEGVIQWTSTGQERI